MSFSDYSATIRRATPIPSIDLTHAPARSSRRLTIRMSAGVGTGPTTLAVNGAADIRRLTGRSTVVVDLKTGPGDVALFLGLRPRPVGAVRVVAQRRRQPCPLRAPRRPAALAHRRVRRFPNTAGWSWC